MADRVLGMGVGSSIGDRTGEAASPGLDTGVVSPFARDAGVTTGTSLPRVCSTSTRCKLGNARYQDIKLTIRRVVHQMNPRRSLCVHRDELSDLSLASLWRARVEEPREGRIRS